MTEERPMKNGMTMNRRQFVATSLAATAGLATNISCLSQESPSSYDIKVGLYSITFLGIWYRGEALSLEDLIQRAKTYGYEGIEIDGKRPHGNPLDWPTQRCSDLRSLADGEGIEIYGVAANNDFSSPVPEYRECQIAYVKDLIRMTSDLGAKTLRLFLGWPGVTKHPQVASYTIARDIWNYTHEQFTEEETWAWCREGMVESARYAEDAGVILALQNHAPVIRSYTDVLRMVEEVNSPNLKVSLDVPIMVDKNPDNIRRAATEVGDLQVLSHFGGEYERDADGTIQGEDYYVPFIRAMKEIGYQGYMSYELCHTLPKIDGETVGVEYADNCAELAAEFMRGLIDSEV